MSDKYVHGDPPHTHNLNAYIKNINSIDEYPENYDNLDELTQDKILNYLNGAQERAYSYYEKHIEQDKELYLDLYNSIVDQLQGAKNILSILGIKVEYNFPREPKQWILATKEDAEQYAKAKFNNCSAANTTNGLQAWPTPQGGRKLDSDKLNFTV